MTDETKVYLLYKCSICGTVFRGKQEYTSFEVDSLLMGKEKSLPLQHWCEDDSIGITTFIGCTSVKNKDKYETYIG